MGNPDLPTPPHVVAKLIEAASKPQNHRYSVSRGIYKLRVAISEWYKRRYQVDIDPDAEAIVTIGAKEGLSHLAWATIDPGDVVLVSQPYLSDSSVCRRSRRWRSALHSANYQRRFFRPSRRSHQADLAQAKNVDHQFSA